MQPFDLKNRRSFLKITGLALLATQLVKPKAFAQAPACAAGNASETDPQAKALGFVTDVKKVDKVKYKDKYKPGQLCANCMFFKGTAKGEDRKKENAPCDPILLKKCVPGMGWCGSHTPDPVNK
jgi:hypothetical protein